jgi:hypothetical protein
MDGIGPGARNAFRSSARLGMAVGFCSGRGVRRTTRGQLCPHSRLTANGSGAGYGGAGVGWGGLDADSDL